MWPHVSLVMVPTRHVAQLQNAPQVACEELGQRGSLYLGRYIPRGDAGLAVGFAFPVPRRYVYPEHFSLVTFFAVLAEDA